MVRTQSASKVCVFVLGLAILAWSPVRAIAQTKIELNNGEASIKGVVAKSDPKDPVRMHPAKRYTVDLKAGESYQIDMIRIGKIFDPYLRLEDPKGAEVASDDDGGDSLNAKIIYDCPANGAYTIVATSFGGTSGAFTLSVKTLGKAAKVEGGKELALNNGFAQVKAKLAATDPKDRVRKNSFAKVYTVALKANKSYVIDLKSTEFDPFLRIENAQGKQLADDDDGGDDLDARLTFEPPADGVYRIIATSFGSGDGEFTLIVRETPK